MAIDGRQKKFAEEMLKDWNQTKAAIRAGYSANSAHVTASRLMKDAKVLAHIARLRDALASEGTALLDEDQEEYGWKEHEEILIQQHRAQLAHYVQGGKVILTDDMPNPAALKSVKQKVYTTKDGREHIETFIELYDSQQAWNELVKLREMRKQKANGGEIGVQAVPMKVEFQLITGQPRKPQGEES